MITGFQTIPQLSYHKIGFSIRTKGTPMSFTDQLTIQTYEGPGTYLPSELLDYSTTPLGIDSVDTNIVEVTTATFGEWVKSKLLTEENGRGMISFTIKTANAMPSYDSDNNAFYQIKFTTDGFTNCLSYYLDCRIDGIKTYDC